MSLCTGGEHGEEKILVSCSAIHFRHTTWSYLYRKDKRHKLLGKMQQGLVKSDSFSSLDYSQGA